ncbi:hypothetical protein POTG_00816 [Paenibacillus sp. oral taxon 786 str. D14]|nr:hypothetical protein POTG_00816 [Paenibacillus sp. oral taxon 786 str. D14]
MIKHNYLTRNEILLVNLTRKQARFNIPVIKIGPSLSLELFNIEHFFLNLKFFCLFFQLILFKNLKYCI